MGWKIQEKPPKVDDISRKLRKLAKNLDNLGYLHPHFPGKKTNKPPRLIPEVRGEVTDDTGECYVAYGCASNLRQRSRAMWLSVAISLLMSCLGSRIFSRSETRLIFFLLRIHGSFFMKMMILRIFSILGSSNFGPLSIYHSYPSYPMTSPKKG